MHDSTADDAGTMESREENQHDEFEELMEKMRMRGSRRSLEIIEEEEEPIHLDNQWDKTKCHKQQLKISGTEKARNTIITVTPKSKWSSVSAKNAIPMKEHGIVYFKVTIKQKEGSIFIGFCGKGMPVDGCVGEQKGTYAYGSDGTFLQEGHKETGKPPFGAEDSVGCGVNLRTGQIIYMKNDQQLDTTNLFIEKSNLSNLYPCITLESPGDKIIAKFKFKKWD